MKKFSKITATLFILVIITFLYFYLLMNNDEKIDYITDLIRLGSIVQKVNATGEVAAVQLVNVGAQVSGQIDRLHVNLGQTVKKGDLVAEIDSTTQINELNTNKAKLETYKAQLASRQIAQQIAETKYKREKSLISLDASSGEKLEDAENTLAAARASVKEMESLVLQAQIAVNTSEVNLSYTKILAPLDGTVVSVAVEEGQTVNANQTTPTIVRIADLTQMEIKIEISEGDVTKVKPGMPVTYTILSEPEVVYRTTLKSIDPGLTTLTNGTYAGSTDSNSAVYYYGKLVVPNENGKLRIGMTTQHIITINSIHNTLIVPTLAIHFNGDKKTVNVLDENRKIHEKEIEIGLSDSMNTQVIAGLSEGEQVILAQMTKAEIDAKTSNVRTPRMRL